MRFEQKTASRRRLKLSDLVVGDIFIYNDCAFMVIPTEEMELDWQADVATIDLQSGETTFFDEGIEVAKLRKEIVIDYDISDLQEWI